MLTGFRAEKVENGAVHGADDAALAYDQLLVTTGRTANTDSLDLHQAQVGVDERGQVRVDDRLRTTNSRIYAAGDVTGRSAFTLWGSKTRSGAVNWNFVGREPEIRR